MTSRMGIMRNMQKKICSRWVKLASCWRGPQKTHGKSDFPNHKNRLPQQLEDKPSSNLPQYFMWIFHCQKDDFLDKNTAFHVETPKKDWIVSCVLANCRRGFFWRPIFICMTLNQKNCHFEPMILRTNPLHVNHNTATCPSTPNRPWCPGLWK